MQQLLSAAQSTRRLILATLALAALVCAAAAGKAVAAHAASGTPPRPTPHAASAGVAATGRPEAPHAAPSTPAGTDYVPGEVLVGYRPKGVVHAARETSAGGAGPATSRVMRVARGHTVWQAIATLRRQRGVAYAVPDYIAHQAGAWIPDDRGNTTLRQGWQRLQWNFLPGAGVDAPGAWANLFAAHRPGGRGVTVAVLDSGVAYRNWGRFRKSPDFAGAHFVAPYDFIADNPYPLDRYGHGTFVAGMIAESTNNRVGLTGLAYGAKIMPVRVLDADGNGDSVTIAKAIRYAVEHGAQVVNLSLTFRQGITASMLPDVISAIGFAHRHGVVVVAAAGNSGDRSVDYPAAAPGVISVGATTRDRCLADYSNGGSRLDLVAPGGGDDASLIGDPDCHPFRILPAVHQMTFKDLSSLTPGANAASFGYPGEEGTSMAAPAVSATAALVIASGVIGRRPSPDRVLARLEQTATPLGDAARPNDDFGWGLVNAAAATARSAPGPV